VIGRMLVMLIVVGAVLGAALGFRSYVDNQRSKMMAGAGPPLQTVSTTKAEMADWQPSIEAVGSLRAEQGTDLSLELGGLVETIEFHSGQDVTAGQLLLRLNADDDIAKLQSLEASAQIAQINYDRDLRQLKPGAVSQAVVDNDAATLKSAQAQANQQRVLIEKKRLRAPFAGRLGLRQVDLGQYLSPGTLIVTLQALDPIFADFYVPQQAADKIKPGQAVKVQVDAFPGRVFSGEVQALSPKVDATTRNFQVRAVVKNPDRALLPGMYAKVTVDSGAVQRFVTLPQTAVAYNSYGTTVFLADDQGKDANGRPKLVARQVLVTTGATRGDQVAILTGVKEGATVVTAGQIKLRQGSFLAVNNAVPAPNDPDPKPRDQ